MILLSASSSRPNVSWEVGTSCASSKTRWRCAGGGCKEAPAPRGNDYNIWQGERTFFTFLHPQDAPGSQMCRSSNTNNPLTFLFISFFSAHFFLAFCFVILFIYLSIYLLLGENKYWR
jgi:hypothetical protein